MVDPLNDPTDAEIAVVPAFMPYATPLLPAALAIVAVPVFELDQMADCKVWALPWLKVPIAENNCVPPRASEVFAGATLIETSPGKIRLAGW